MWKKEEEGKEEGKGWRDGWMDRVMVGWRAGLDGELVGWLDERKNATCTDDEAVGMSRYRISTYYNLLHLE
jgi:hypothetical protein